MLTLARYISNAFNPLVIFVLIITTLIYYTTGNPIQSIRWFMAAVVFSFLATITLLIAVKHRIFTNFDVSRKKDRPILFLGAGVIMLAFIFIGMLLKFERNIIVAFVIGLFGIVIYSAVNRRIKASVHLGVFIVFISMLTFLFDLRFGILYFLAPLLAWARITEKEHTIAEVTVGSILGVLLSVCFIFLLQ